MNLGIQEILIVLVIALLLFGPKKLPELGRSLGQSIREFKKGAAEIKEEIEAAMEDRPGKSEPSKSDAKEG